MNKMTLTRKPYVSALVFMFAILAGMLGSCQKETADTGDLLATVPSSSGFVAGINLKSVLEKSGCKVDGSEIKAGDAVTAWIDSKKDAMDSRRNALKLFLDGESGVDPSVAIFFTDAYNNYLTASLADTEKFENFVATQSGEQFEDAGNGVRTCGNVAVKGVQAWICVSSNNTIDSKAVANYATLGDSQSFLKNGISSDIAKMTSDIVGWGDIKSFSKAGLPVGQLSSANMLLNAAFDGASSVSFNVDFRKGEAAASLKVLNSKGENAKCLLPLAKLDVPTVKSIGESAQLLVAVSITSDFVKKLDKIGGSMLGQITEMLKPVDGTVAVALGNLNDPESSLEGVVTTDGDPTRDFMSMLSQFGNTKKDGKLVRFSKGSVSGGVDVSKASDDMKGAFAGVVADLGGLEENPMFKILSVMMVPDGGGVRCDITLESGDASKNILLSMIEADAE